MKASERDARMERFRVGRDVRARRHDRAGGRRRRARGDRDADPRRGPLRRRAAPPAARSRRPWRLAVVLHPRLVALPARNRRTSPTTRRWSESGSTPWSSSPTASSWPRRTSSSAARARCSGLQQSGLPPLRVATLSDPAPPRAVARRASAGRAAGRRSGCPALGPRRLRSRADAAAGWPASVPARSWRPTRCRSVPDGGRVIAGSAAGIRLDGTGGGDAAALRSCQAVALRCARVGPGRIVAGPVPGPVRRQRRGRHRGAQPRRAECHLRRARPEGRAQHRREPAPSVAVRWRRDRAEGRARLARDRR